MKKTACLVKIKDAQRPRATLVCFPYAGGGAGAFHGWAKHLPDWARLIGVEMPGRGSRFREPPFVSTKQVLAEVMESIGACVGGQLVLFGHSLGALLAFDTARALERAGGLPPLLFIASGKLPPHLPENTRSGAYQRKRARNFLPVHTLNDDAFMEELRLLNGTPQDILENDKLMELCLPYLRADFRINDEYQMIDLTKLSCPLLTMGGEADCDVPLHELQCWSELTWGRSEHHTFSGDHFFIHSHEAQVVSVINSTLAGLLYARAGAESSRWPAARQPGGWVGGASPN
jgi:medium-chain acyl-[acyl-carrier-protein] hydrolase